MPGGSTGSRLSDLLRVGTVELTDHPGLSRETVRRPLAEKDLKPWQKKVCCVPAVDAKYVARMGDVLELYTENHDPARPVVCFDETPRQLIGEPRVPTAPAPGRRARWDYEYKRNGTASVFIFLDRHRPWRHVKVTDHRANEDFAQCMRDLVDVHYPKAERIRIVLGNVSTHADSALYEAFPPEKARRILRRLDKQTLIRELAARERRRNLERTRITWLFTVERAREKMGRAYPGRVQQAAALVAA